MKLKALFAAFTSVYCTAFEEGVANADLANLPAISISDANGNAWKINQSSLKLLSGEPLVLSVIAEGNNARLQDQSSLNFLQASQTAPPPWTFSLNTNGSYTIRNDSKVVGYDFDADEIISIPEGDPKATVWYISQVAKIPQLNIVGPASLKYGDSNRYISNQYPSGFSLYSPDGRPIKSSFNFGQVTLNSGKNITLKLDRRANAYDVQHNWNALLDINSQKYLRHSGLTLWDQNSQVGAPEVGFIPTP